MLGWLQATYPPGMPPIVRPEVPKLHKISWDGVKYDGTPERFNGWMQKVLSIKESHQIPDVLPVDMGRQVTHAIAARFSGIASDAWLNTPMALRPTQVGNSDPDDKDQTKLIPWMRHRFRSHTHAIVKQRELTSFKWDQERVHLNVHVETFNLALREAGYTTAGSCPEPLKVEWFLNSLPRSLAKSVQSQLNANEELSKRMHDLWTAANPAGQANQFPQFQPTLESAQNLAVREYTTRKLQEEIGPPKPKRSEARPPRRDNRSSTNQVETRTCNNCGRKGHLARDCRAPKKDNRQSNTSTRGKNSSQSQYPTCARCQEPHPWGKHTKTPDGRKILVTQVVDNLADAALLAQTGNKTDASKPRPTPPTIKVVIGGKKLNGIIDCGSQVTIISQEVLKALGLKIDAPSSKALIGVDGKVTTPLGIIKQLPIHVGGLDLPWDTLVVASNAYQLVLGWDWQKHFRIQLDAHNMNLSIRKKRDKIVVAMTDGLPRSQDGDNDEDEELVLEPREMDKVISLYAAPVEDLQPSDVSVWTGYSPQSAETDELLANPWATMTSPPTEFYEQLKEIITPVPVAQES